MDLILRNARIAGAAEEGALVDIGVEGGRIVQLGPRLQAGGRAIDVDGRLVGPGFVETHIHLDKSRLLDRCRSDEGTLEEAIAQVAAAKKGFTAEDVHRRAAATLEQAILQGTTHMRTHLEVDPGIGLRSLEGVLPLVEEYRWGIDLQVCVFPQEGLLNNPGTDELMVAALERGARVVGAAPYTDGHPKGQIDRVFEMAREFDVDIDMHLDFGHTVDELDIDYVCAQTERFRYGGRVAVGHVTKLSVLPPARLTEVARRAAAAGVALTVLPSTDLYLMGRHQDQSVLRGVVPIHKLLGLGVNCSLSSNNILNPFTPFGDCSLIRMANLYANICQVGKRDDTRECFELITRRSARLLRLDDYGVAVGKSADLVVLDCTSAEAAVAQVATPLYGFKRGRMTFTRERPTLLRPS
ncbi:MAG: amidohydrolase family protein [Candidatus Rokuibacteriota bacterium]